jgi:hypothetical protein
MAHDRAKYLFKARFVSALSNILFVQGTLSNLIPKDLAMICGVILENLCGYFYISAHPLSLARNSL